MNLCRKGASVGCGEDFGFVSAFDSHRVGRHDYTYSEGAAMDPPRDDGRRCLSAREMENLRAKDGVLPVFERNKSGAWSLSRSLRFARGWTGD